MIGLGERLTFYYYYGSGRYAKRTYYYSYDWNSFLADVGGYRGLLLGHSMMSFYDAGKSAVEWLANWKTYVED